VKKILVKKGAGSLTTRKQRKTMQMLSKVLVSKMVDN
jgi:hypothetical protein